MRIIGYDELPDKAQLAVLGDSAFGWVPTPERTAERRRHDPRYRDTYGYGALEGGLLVGFVGVLQVGVRSRTGRPLPAGGIHSVMTRPGHTRRGIARRLIEHCHEHFRARGCAVSFLFTSRSLVAVGLYRQLDYVELPLSGRPAPTAYLVRAVKGKPPKPARQRPDHARLERLFDRHGRRLSDFLREPGWLKGRMTAWQEGPDHLVIDRDGYAYIDAERNVVRVFELVAKDDAGRRRLLGRIEGLGRPATICHVVNDPATRRLLAARGYAFRPEGFGLLMARSLSDVPLARLLPARFCYSPVDQF
jgi:GNAT superfamily N-acetyltransferase